MRWLVGSGWGAGATMLPTATLALVHSTTEYCAPVWCRSAHTRLIESVINDAFELWLDACVLHQRTTFLSRKHPIYWASSQRSYTFSSTPCHGAWTPTPLSVHLSIEWECTVSQIDTPICTSHTTTYWVRLTTTEVRRSRQSPMECWVVAQHHETPYFHLRHPSWNGPAWKSLGPA